MKSITLDNVRNISIENAWNFSDSKELLMHSIHAYPAKFPAFIATKAFDYAEHEGVEVKTVADIFCGCGTVALEAKLHNKNFWGCDINPVATLIAKTKSETYNINSIEQYFINVEETYNNTIIDKEIYNMTNSCRLKYWYTEDSYLDLYNIKHAIEVSIPIGKYRDAFFCIFSSVLKNSSKWLNKSIKPQVDPNKKKINVWNLFKQHYEKFLKAVNQINDRLNCERENIFSEINIYNQNFLNIQNLPHVDLIISSPPYVTSYEYADLHQLSSLWLNYTDDYRELRKGSIGSVYNCDTFDFKLESLNNIGRQIVNSLLDNKRTNAKVRSVARYYIDIQNAIKNCSKMLNPGGMAFFVVGDTEYKNVKILNSEHLIECLKNEGFCDIKAAKRRISNKLLTPYRDKCGRFSSDKNQREIYHEEFIISGRMLHI